MAKHESLKAMLGRVLSVEARGRRPVGHAIAITWTFVILLLVRELLLR